MRSRRSALGGGLGNCASPESSSARHRRCRHTASGQSSRGDDCRAGLVQRSTSLPCYRLCSSGLDVRDPVRQWPASTRPSLSCNQHCRKNPQPPPTTWVLGDEKRGAGPANHQLARLVRLRVPRASMVADGSQPRGEGRVSGLTRRGNCPRVILGLLVAHAGFTSLSPKTFAADGEWQHCRSMLRGA